LCGTDDKHIRICYDLRKNKRNENNAAGSLHRKTGK
jgi:hypothetical protein